MPVCLSAFCRISINSSVCISPAVTSSNLTSGKLLVIALCAGFTSCSDDDEEENSVEISLANLQGTWDMIKCYGWEYDDNNQKENWTEDVSGEYIFFEDTDGNGGYSDGSHTYYFASSINGNKLILRDSGWLAGKSITITKLTKTELHITATDENSEENYEMIKR